MVVANKQDKAEALSKEDIKRILELEGDIYKVCESKPSGQAQYFRTLEV